MLLRFSRPPSAIGFIMSIVLLNACSKSDAPQPDTPELKPGPEANIISDRKLSRWPELSNAKTGGLEIEQQVTALLDKMSLAEKVGQMTQAEIAHAGPVEVKTYHLGSLLNGGDNFVNNDRNASIQDWVDYMDAIYDASMDESDGRIAIPITYGTDAVHGNSKFGFATIFPHNIGLGATRNPELMRRIGEITALEVLAAGIDWTFAPTLAVVRDDRWGRTYESFSEDPELVANYADKIVEGLQGVAGTDSFMSDQHVYATAKHWVGDGGTVKGVDQGDNIMDEQTLIDQQASAYFPAIQAGVQSIMISHSQWHGERMHGHRYLITDVLKQRLNFDGFIIGDWNAHARVEGCSADSCPQAVNAGVDMFMVTEDYREFIANTIRQVEEGIIPMARINDAVSRILRVKIRSGLMQKGRPSSRTHAGNAALMGAEAHREVARQAVRESLVLLKNNQQLLPLSRKQHVLVAGDGAHNIPKQAGAWTINWQGNGNKNEDFRGASSIFDGIRDTVTAGGGSIELNEDGSFEQQPDVAIVVFGENPYAEWQGDLQSIAYKPYSSQDYDLLKSLKGQNIPVVAVFITGRPLWVNRELNTSDAFIAAWLPGSEGGAIADVLFRKSDGSIHHDFTGKLSFSWPKRASQLVLNKGDDNYDPLFPYGYGLTYTNHTELALLDEQSDYEPPQDTHAAFDLFTKGLTEPWQLYYEVDNTKYFLEAMRASNDVVDIREADKVTQGDAVEVTWSGKQTATVGISSPWFRTSTIGYLRQGGALVFEVRSLRKPEGPLLVRIGCPSGYCGNIDISEQLRADDEKTWRRISIPLNCFAKDGAELELNSLPFALKSEAAATLRITQIQYSFEADSAPTHTCN